VSKGEASPQVLEDWLPLLDPRIGQRSVKMLRPVCRICEGRGRRARDWLPGCTHDPYITMARIPDAPQFEDMLDDEGKPTGHQRLVEGAVSHFEPKPNVAEITLSMKVNSGMGVEKQRAKGFILPSELRSPHFPNGIAEACQFRGCREQKNLKPYGPSGVVGTYHRDREAALVMYSEKESLGALEIGWNANSEELRNDQLALALSKMDREAVA
jgi:hypothetical protein